jgi:S-adenosylmethionine hydrolase
MSVRPSGIVALLTDFGLRDPYVGVMKGVILSVHPDARIIDLSHDVPSQAVLEAYFLLSNTYRYFPVGTVFVAVVDPGVGTDRAILAVETGRYLFLAPDNGLLGFLEKEGAIRRIVRVQEKKYFLQPVSNTFHGRDIFAPVAGHLSRGLNPGRLGPEVDTLVRIAPPAPQVTREGVIRGEVVRVDHFGNLITNIPADSLAQVGGKLEIRVGRSVLRNISRSYGDAPKGKLIAVIGSTGHLEISVNQGNAQKKTGARVGAPVRIHHAQP